MHPILLCVAIIVFTLMCFVPGDPVRIALGDFATEQQVQEFREAYGLNRPYLVRLVDYMDDIFLHLDFGESYITGTSVSDELISRFPHTLILAAFSVLVTVVLGIPTGIVSAVSAGKLGDKIMMFITLLVYSMPAFWLALLMVLFFSLQLGLVPSSGISSWTCYILPVLANSLTQVAAITRQTRASMLEVVNSDFVTTARSKGLPERKVIYGHALPNAIIPIITVCGTRFGVLLGGTTIIESVFSIPGIGTYMISGINTRDYPIVEGCVIYIAFMFSIIMLLTDLIYAFVDPRIKAQYAGQKKKKDKPQPKGGVTSEA